MLCRCVSFSKWPFSRCTRKLVHPWNSYNITIKLTMFNRRYIFKIVFFSIVLLVLRAVRFFFSSGFCFKKRTPLNPKFFGGRVSPKSQEDKSIYNDFNIEKQTTILNQCCVCSHIFGKTNIKTSPFSFGSNLWQHHLFVENQRIVTIST